MVTWMNACRAKSCQMAIVHNHVTPARPLALNGDREVQDSADDLVECDCSFGRNRNAKMTRTSACGGGCNNSDQKIHPHFRRGAPPS